MRVEREMDVSNLLSSSQMLVLLVAVVQLMHLGTAGESMFLSLSFVLTAGQIYVIRLCDKSINMACDL